ncbi:hypothetical protein BDR22DRAFT_819880 [Usnea florida]
MAKKILPILGTLMLLSSTTFAAVDCNSTDSEAFYDASCWASLNLTNWLSTWQAPSVCGDTGSGRNCCLENEAWSTCFLRLGTGNSGYNCSQISVNTNVCAYSGALASDLDPSIQAQVRYVLRTIFNVNAFFNDWYNALQFATTNTSLSITPIVTAVNPVKSTTIAFGDILSALVAGLAFIGAPAFTATIAASASAQALVTGLQQAPGLVKALWPTGSAESQIIQIGNLDSALSSESTQISSRINAGLWSLMSSQKSFALFASSGAFSADPGLSIPQDVAQISTGLQLFVLSKALNANKYRAQILPTASIASGAEPSLCDWKKGQDVCYHNDTLLGGVVFDLEKTDANDGNHGLSMASTIIQGGWASPQSLYQGAYDCAASGLSGQGLD